jgi:outer membrane protein
MSEMSKSSKWVGGFVLSALLAGGMAQAQAPIKIGVVNFSRLIEEAPQARASSDALNAEFAPRIKDLQNRFAAQKARTDRYQKDQATMSPDQRTKLEKEIRDEERELARRRGEIDDDSSARRNEELAKINRLLIDEVRTYARAQNYDLVLADNAVAYANASVDITSAVLGALTARATPAGGAKPAAPAQSATPAPRPPAPRQN